MAHKILNSYVMYSMNLPKSHFILGVENVFYTFPSGSVNSWLLLSKVPICFLSTKT